MRSTKKDFRSKPSFASLLRVILRSRVLRSVYTLVKIQVRDSPVIIRVNWTETFSLILRTETV